MTKYLAAPLVLLVGGVWLGVAACEEAPRQQPAATPPVAVSPPATPPLTRQQLGKTNFFISLPADYALKMTEGPDFLVYYFAPADTTVQTSFTGGLYFGNHPQGSDSVAGCFRRRLPATLLHRPATWLVQQCATGYTLNAVFDSRSGEHWNEKINAFGTSRSAAELRQLLAVFATLQQEPQP